jgi:hypothetical protein
MTSIRQIEANRRNAQKSTGPKTGRGKQRASQNAIRHGLTAETVVTPLEDVEDYNAFEQAIISDYEAETAVERELCRCSGVFVSTKRILARVTASQIASASAMSFFCRLT